MPISGSDRALMYCQAGVARAGASRLGYHSPKVFVSVGGIHRANGKETPSHKLEGLVVSETNTETPNRASFQAMGWIPEVGMEVLITIGSKNRIRRLFGGTILNVKQSASGLLPIFDVECVDWSWLLDDEPIYGHFTGSASSIATQLMADAPTGFTARQVESGLPTLEGGITFTGVKRSAALRRLAKRAGARTFIDYQKDLYFRVTPSTARTNPTPVVGVLHTMKQFKFERDLGQIANRVPFIGGGATALTEVAVGETVLPLTAAPDWWYGDVGGVVLSGPQRIAYAARSAGGEGSLVGPGAQPSSAPGPTRANGSGVTTGVHQVAFTHVTASGESLPSPVGAVTSGVVASPSVAPTAGVATVGSGPDDGPHYYAVSDVTPSGETLPSPVSATRTTSTAPSRFVTAPSATPGVSAPSNVSTVPGSQYAPGDSLYYQLVFENANGTTTPGPTSATAVAQACSNPFTPGFASPIDVSGLDVSSDPTVTNKRLYRNVNGSWTGYSNIANAVTTQGDNSIVTAGSPPVSNTASVAAVPSQVIALSGIHVPTDPLVTSKKVYGTAAGGSQLKFIASIAVGTTSYNVTTADSGLGANAPVSNTAVANQIAVTGVATGQSGVVTARNVYMTAAGGSQLKYVTQIANNVGTTLTITTPDGSLGANAPVSDTSGLDQPSGQVVSGATSFPVAGTAPFLAAGGWAFTGTQFIRYTGFSGNLLTGIPANGAGAVVAAIGYNTTIAAAACLTGIPASGDGSILYTINKGDAVNLCVTVEDTDAQVELQALLTAPAPVVRECPPLSDERVGRAEAFTRATAFLTLRAYPGVRLGPYRSKDVNNRVGQDVIIDVTSPLVLNDTFQIQAVTISNFTPSIMPDYAVQASDELFSLEALLAKES